MRTHVRSVTLSLLLVSGLTAASASADTITVCWDGSGDYLTIQEGIDAAVDGDEVVVCDGVYTGLGNKDLDFHGKAITVRSVGGPENCIIDCENDAVGFYFHTGETNASAVQGLTIRNGHLDPDGPRGAIYCDQSSPLIRECIIIRNPGGGIACDSASPLISNCTIADNAKPRYWSGAGVACWGSASPQIVNCTITGNTAGWAGGGIGCFADSTVTIRDCTIAGNTAEYGGGGIYLFRCAATIMNCVVAGNRAVSRGEGNPLRHRGSGGGVFGDESAAFLAMCMVAGNAAASGEGGGLYFRQSEVVIAECTILGNSSQTGGGGLCAVWGDATITNSTIVANTTGWRGGGALCTDGHYLVANCVIAQNIAESSGGGLSTVRAGLTLSNCTITRNVVHDPNGNGGGVAVSGGNATIGNSILWGDSGGGISLMDTSVLGVLYSLVRGGEEGVFVEDGSELDWGIGNLETNPLFDVYNRTYRLMPGSPCIDAGCNWGVPADFADLDDDGDIEEFTPLDLDGEGRFFDDPATDDTGHGCPPIVDMGAYEFGGAGPQPCLGDLDCDRYVGESDLAILLAAWGMSIGGDLNCDGVTNQSDLGILLAVWGQNCP